MADTRAWWVLGALLAAGPSASADDGEALIQRVEARYARVNVIQANFVQTQVSGLYGEDEPQRGDLVLKRPSSMRWDFGDKQYITDGATLWMYTISEKQVMRFPNFSAPPGSPQSLLQSLDHLSEVFTVTVVEAAADKSVLDLRPKGDSGFDKVRLELDKELMLTKVQIHTGMGTTDLVFADVVFNAEVSDSQFTFQVPQGVEIIEGGL